jgi:hypothetical protein
MSKSIKYRLSGGISGEYDSLDAAAAAVEKQSVSGEYAVHAFVCVKPDPKPASTSAHARPADKSLDAIRAQLAAKK